MKTIEVLGTGCPKCKATIQVLENVARMHGVEIEIRKVETIPDIIARGVMTTPAVVIEGKVVVAGRVPTPKEVEAWLA